jgi:filamentous hemagglutinin
VSHEFYAIRPFWEIQSGRAYEYDVLSPGGGTLTMKIRDDANGHTFKPVDGQPNPQDRGPHFNDENGGHYDY